MAYELIISRGNDSSSGIYETRLQAMDAADEAAAVDDLVAVYGNGWSAGCFRDQDGMSWYHFEIRRVDEE